MSIFSTETQFFTHLKIALISCSLFFSCKQHILPQTPDKLYEKYRNSVVLIRNQYYYEIKLSNRTTAYFTEFKNGKILGLTFDEDEAIKNANTIYGTGFFVSKEGKLATNRHVVYPIINDADVLAALKINFDNIKFKIQDYQQELTAKISNIENYISNNYDQLDFPTVQELNKRKQDLDIERMKLTIENSTFDFDPSRSDIKAKSVFLGIAYENTFVNRQSDFKECVFIKKASDEDIDLALIQLKDKTTPENIQNIFDFDDHNPNLKNGTMEKEEEFDISKPLKIDTKVYMIGFNYGFEVANTRDGLKAQLTQGTVSQESDDNNVLYSIPSLPGSSGSPVIDQWGNLVAINFAKIGNTQSFNYGIMAKHLKELINGRK